MLLLCCLAWLLTAGQPRLSWAEPPAATAPGATTVVEPTSPLALAATLTKVIGALAAVLGLMVLLLFLIKKLGLAQGGLTGSSLIRVIDSRMIAPKKYIAVVEIGEELLAVGIAEQSISLLTKLDRQQTLQATTAAQSGKPEPSRFRALLAKAMGGG